MHHKGTHITEDDRSTGSVAGANAPVASPARRSGQPVILIHRSAPPPVASGDASSPDWDVPPTIGELAVRLVARFTLPRMKMLPPSREGDDGSARQSSIREG
jgi:hypothetical protein